MRMWWIFEGKSELLRQTYCPELIVPDMKPHPNYGRKLIYQPCCEPSGTQMTPPTASPGFESSIQSQPWRQRCGF